MEPLRILISNDDGILSKGIRTLAKEATIRGHKVTIVCPDKERSATGHGLTLHSPIRAERADDLFHKGVTAWACTGTPADCVKLALNELLETKPNLVLSGINHGPNLGTDIFCSGTVAAALEGTLENIPSLAASNACFKWDQFDYASKLTLLITENFLSRKIWPGNMLLNLNIPPCSVNQMGSLSWSRLSIRQYKEQFSKRVDPNGNTYYWLAGKAVNDIEKAGSGPASWPSDVTQIERNRPSITPIQPDLFWRGDISKLPSLNHLDL